MPKITQTGSVLETGVKVQDSSKVIVQSMEKPFVMVSSWPEMPCGIGTFAEEAVENGIKPNLDDRPIHIISHKGGKPQNGEIVHPIIDISEKDWWQPVAEEIIGLDPYTVHVQHEYDLYVYKHRNGKKDYKGILKLLEELKSHKIPTIVEPHTVHMRPNEREAKFLKQLLEYATIVILKEPYLRERLEWVLEDDKRKYKLPRNIAVIRHGAMMGYADSYKNKREEVLKQLSLEDLKGKKIVELSGWIQKNKRWDYVLANWESILAKINERGGNADEWMLLAGGQLRDPKRHKKAHDMYMGLLKSLEERKLARFYEFIPRNEEYYKVMSLADIVVLPSIDETQSGTLARVIALNKPYVTFNLEGLGLQTVESQGGLLAVDTKTLIDRIVDLAIDSKKREGLSQKLANYLEKIVGWPITGKLYNETYKTAKEAMNNGGKAFIVDGPLYDGRF